MLHNKGHEGFIWHGAVWGKAYEVKRVSLLSQVFCNPEKNSHSNIASEISMSYHIVSANTDVRSNIIKVSVIPSFV